MATRVSKTKIAGHVLKYYCIVEKGFYQRGECGGGIQVTINDEKMLEQFWCMIGKDGETKQDLIVMLENSIREYESKNKFPATTQLFKAMLVNMDRLLDMAVERKEFKLE